MLTLRALLAMAGGASRLPDLARGEAVFARLCSGAAMRVPLSRAVADARRGAVWIRREARDLPCADAGQPMLWDGRWRIEAQASPEGLRVAPLGPERAAQWTGEAGDAPKSLVRAALSGEPALFSHAEFIGLAAEGAGAVRVVSPFARFLPDFDLALADALARMGNARRPPPSPWKDHIGTQA